MEIIELIIDEENNEFAGVEAISVVDNPATEELFVALNEQKKIELAEVDKDKRILMGCALVPNKPIYRIDPKTEKEFYVYFSSKTVRKASEIFFKRSNQSNATLEHDVELNGMTVIESWIVEDPKMDKSNLYGLNAPKGSWMISMKVDDLEIWEDYCKNGKVRGFSIEGFFADKSKLNMGSDRVVDQEELKETLAQEELNKIINYLNQNK